MNWSCKPFAELSTWELFKIYHQRVAVFVVEQACSYPEVDKHDPDSWHLYTEQNGDIIAYCRFYLDTDGVHIGRVLVAQNQRGKGLASKLMQRAMDTAQRIYPQQDLHVQAQAHLHDFYAGLGFVAVSDVYLEDNIPHLDIILSQV